MSYEAKNTYAAMFSGVLIFGVYYFVVSGMHAEGRFEGADALALLGKVILSVMLGGIILHIVVTILMHIVMAVITRDESPSFVVDERDKHIELRGLQVSYYIFSAGFIGAIIAMALGVSAFAVINLLFACCAFGTFTEGFLKLFLYRRGF